MLEKSTECDRADFFFFLFFLYRVLVAKREFLASVKYKKQRKKKSVDGRTEG